MRYVELSNIASQAFIFISTSSRWIWKLSRQYFRVTTYRIQLPLNNYYYSFIIKSKEHRVWRMDATCQSHLLDTTIYQINYRSWWLAISDQNTFHSHCLSTFFKSVASILCTLWVNPSSWGILKVFWVVGSYYVMESQ